MKVCEAFVDRSIGLFGLDSFGHNGYVAHKKECAARDAVLVADDEDRCCFHIDGKAAHVDQTLAERVIPFPHSPIGCIDNAGTVFLTMVDDLFRNILVKLEGGQGRYEGREVVVTRAVAPYRCDR